MEGARVHPLRRCSRGRGGAAGRAELRGAPAGRKALLLWQPPELPPSAAGGDAPDADASAAPQRKSVYHEAGELLAEIVAAGLKPLVFVSARMLSEIVANNGRVALRERGLAGAAAGVESYRGGYSAAERRSLVGPSAERVRAFQLHRFIEQHLHGLGHSRQRQQ